MVDLDVALSAVGIFLLMVLFVLPTAMTDDEIVDEFVMSVFQSRVLRERIAVCMLSEILALNICAFRLSRFLTMARASHWLLIEWHRQLFFRHDGWRFCFFSSSPEMVMHFIQSCTMSYDSDVLIPPPARYLCVSWRITTSSRRSSAEEFRRSSTV
jgi:hypothetical protein